MMLGKKTLRIVATSLVLLIAAIIWGNYQVKNALKLAFANKVLLLNKSQPLEISYERISISIWNKSFEINDVLVLPDAELRGNQNNSHISIASIEVDDFKILPLLFRKHLLVEDFKVSGFEVVYKKREATQKKDANPKKSGKPSNPNAITKLSLNNFQVQDYSMYVLDSDSRDTINSLLGEKLIISGIDLVKDSTNHDVLSLNTDNVVFKLSEQTLTIGKDKNAISIDSLAFTPILGSLKVNGLKVGDEKTSRETIQRQKFNRPATSYHIPYTEVFGIRTDSFFSQAFFLADSITVNDAAFTILKDLKKPWNEEKILPIPQHVLRKEKSKFWLGKIQIENALIDYIEIVEDKEIHIPVDNLNATVLNVGTIQSKYQNLSDNAMTIHLRGKVLNAMNFVTSFKFINPLDSNFFQFSGNTGPFTFESLNPVMIPSTSIKFESGKVHEILFSGEGNEEQTKGELVMRFNNLKSSVLKKNSTKRKKTFSWLANTAVRTENPKKGKLKTAQINYKRIPYKGFGNYMVKSVESGLINSVYPFGRRHTEK